MTTTDRFRPQTKTEREMLAECDAIARENGIDVVTILEQALRYWQFAGRYWQFAGRSRQPRLWKSRAAAADRLIARGQAIAEFTAAGLDPFVEVEGFARLDADRLRDELTYLADYQG